MTRRWPWVLPVPLVVIFHPVCHIYGRRKKMGEDMTAKVAMVTGAGAGIGRAIACGFGRAGAAVVVADIDSRLGSETVELIRRAGGHAEYQPCDVSKAADVKAMVDGVVAQFGHLDYACNNAGIHNPTPESLVDADEDVWDRIIAINLKGIFLCMKHEVRHMVQQGGGVIVNTASLSGLIAEPGCYAYVATKHGIMGLTKTAAIDYARAGIRVNAVCPGPIDTPGLAEAPEEFRQRLRETTPVGRLGTPDEVASAVLWLCSDLAGFVTGAGIVMDGGISTV
jgi:NAD(P)-dependent dehydrogenase (short-subunit alcohol dehydrogenase family)